MRRFTYASLNESAGDRRNDADRVPIFGRRILLGQVTNVFVVHIHIHEAPQLAIFSEEMFAQITKLHGQLSEGFADSLGGNFSRIGLARVHAQGCWNNHFYRHLSSSFGTKNNLGLKQNQEATRCKQISSSSNSVRSSVNRHEVISSGIRFATLTIM